MPYKNIEGGRYTATGPLAGWLYDLRATYEEIVQKKPDRDDEIWDAFLLIAAHSLATKAKLTWDRSWFLRGKSRKLEPIFSRFINNEAGYLDVFDYMAKNMSLREMRVLKEESIPEIAQIVLEKLINFEPNPSADRISQAKKENFKLTKGERQYHYPLDRFPARWFGPHDNSISMKVEFSPGQPELRNFPGVKVPGFYKPENHLSSVFLSYSHRDKEFAKKLTKDLLLAKIAVWFDESEVRIGDSLSLRIRSGIEAMEYFGVIVSPNSLVSEWVKMEMEAAGKLEENKKLTILPILYESCNVTDFLQDRILIDFTDPDRYRLSFEALLNRLLDLPLPVYMTAKEAARLIKVTCDPNGGLCGLSQQGICQQITYEPIRLRGDWYYADVKTGKSTIWILEYYDPLPQNLYTYSVIDGKVDTLASGKLDSSMRVVDFNFIDSDIAVSIALKETRSILPALLENNTYFVDTMMKYCGPIDDYLWFVIFYDLTLTNITYIVEVDPYNGKVSRSYKPPENRLKPRS